MRPSEHDPCVYYKFHENTDWLIVLLFVDDFFITGSHNLIEQFTNHLKNKFEISISDNANRYIYI
jgi:hypothetical protein